MALRHDHPYCFLETCHTRKNLSAASGVERRFHQVISASKLFSYFSDRLTQARAEHQSGDNIARVVGKKHDAC